MKKDEYLKKIAKKSPTQLEKFLKELTYTDIYELWTDITGNTLTITDESEGTTRKLKKLYHKLFEADIYSRTLNGYIRLTKDNKKEKTDA